MLSKSEILQSNILIIISYSVYKYRKISSTQRYLYTVLCIMYTSIVIYTLHNKTHNMSLLRWSQVTSRYIVYVCLHPRFSYTK